MTTNTFAPSESWRVMPRHHLEAGSYLVLMALEHWRVSPELVFDDAEQAQYVHHRSRDRGPESRCRAWTGVACQRIGTIRPEVAKPPVRLSAQAGIQAAAD